MRMKKIIAAIMAVVLIMAGAMAKDYTAKAASSDVIIDGKNLNLIIVPGETTHIKVPIKAISGVVYNPDIAIEQVPTNPFAITDPVITRDGVAVRYIISADISYLEFDVSTDETAQIGTYPVKVTFTSEDIDSPIVTSITPVLEVSQEKIAPRLTVDEVVGNNAPTGGTTAMAITVKNEGEILARNVYVKIKYGDTGITRNYTIEDIKVGDLAAGAKKSIPLPIKISSTATAGNKTLTAEFSYKTKEGEKITSSYDFAVNIIANQTESKVNVINMKDPGSLKPGTNFDLTVAVGNGGTDIAQNVIISVDASSISKDGVLKNFFEDGIEVEDIKADGKRNVKIPLTISKYATGGMKEIKLNLNYTYNGVPFTATNTVYVDVLGDAATGSANLVISGVKQSPSAPVAGDKMTVSFYLENKSTVDISELKIYLDNLAGNTFIPIDSEPYKYYETVKGGAKIKVTIPLMLSKAIPEGLNNLQLHYTYTGSDSNPVVTIPVHDVQNDLDTSSKPKLIVSKYYTDEEELKAGSTFNFNFEIHNTNANAAAKNITITATQAENVFTVTQGSNSFFFSKIGPGETVTNTLQFKIKSDAATGAYKLKITIDYEYEGEEVTENGAVIKKTLTDKQEPELNLQVVENARPVVDNVAVSSMDGNIVIGNPATLGFEFYNMGKSQLNNVIATVEGDFTKSDGSMYFIGNVQPGNSAYADFEVIPNIEGNAKGVVKITFEDSNGDSIELSKDFETVVNPAQTIDPGMPGDGSGEVFNPEAPAPKKAIMPVWLFVILQLVIFGAFIPITRKIIISVYRSKLRKKEEENY